MWSGCGLRLINTCIGDLCGRCAENYSVTLDLRDCAEDVNCHIGLGVYIFSREPHDLL